MKLCSFSITGLSRCYRCGVIAAILAILAPCYSEVSFVTPAGSAGPEVNQFDWSWQLVEAAAAALPDDGGHVYLSPGTYRQTAVLSKPATLDALWGPATIGDLSSVSASTTFSVLTWNTHLFGATPFLPSWMDFDRSSGIGFYLQSRYNDLDFVGLNEVWDQNLFLHDDDRAGIQELSGFPNWMLFNQINSGIVFCSLAPLPRVLHSGLALMTKHPISDDRRVHYNDCYGDCPGLDESPDCLASKGFMAVTTKKDGFDIRVYITHTQAGNGLDFLDARQKQLVQLTDEVGAYRAAHPSIPVLVMGDMNVIGETASQYYFCRERFVAIGGHDAARNTADVFMYRNHRVADTLTKDNELAVHFDPSTANQRLDYVWYFSSLDGRVEVLPTHVESLRPPPVTFLGDADFASDELSDHYPLEARFQLNRLQ